MQVRPLGVSGDKIVAELQKAERLDMLEGCGEMPLRPPSVRGFLSCGSRMSVPGQSEKSGRSTSKSVLTPTPDIALRRAN
jgi:hypothetical protein